MKKKIIVTGPVLSQSGYGEHARFVLRSLRRREEEYDIYILPTSWGETGWLSTQDEERAWFDTRINETLPLLQNKTIFDVSVQVTIPNEWQRIAAINIGVTAGIETTAVSGVWLEKSNEMDKIITISEFAKKGFVETFYTGTNTQTGEQIKLSCNTPIEVVHYPVKKFGKTPKLDLKLDYDFNYLAVAQWGPRKNLHNLIRWFVEENIDQEVGLVLKTSLKNNSINDRIHVERVIKSLIPNEEDIKCKVYLLHGDMSEAEMHSLYKHPKIKSMICLSHGEGFGLPLFEAAYSGLPIIAPGWSGHCDFLYKPEKSISKKKKDKTVMKPYFAEVGFTIGPVPDTAVWEGVVEKHSNWAYPTEGSYKMRLRQMRNDYDKWLKKAKSLKKWVSNEFNSDKKHDQMADTILSLIDNSQMGAGWLQELESSLAINE